MDLFHYYRIGYSHGHTYIFLSAHPGFGRIHGAYLA